MIWVNWALYFFRQNQTVRKDEMINVPKDITDSNSPSFHSKSLLLCQHTTFQPFDCNLKVRHRRLYMYVYQQVCPCLKLTNSCHSDHGPVSARCPIIGFSTKDSLSQICFLKMKITDIRHHSGLIAAWTLRPESNTICGSFNLVDCCVHY